jgi:hypothetical protein
LNLINSETLKNNSVHKVFGMAKLMPGDPLVCPWKIKICFFAVFFFSGSFFLSVLWCVWTGGRPQTFYFFNPLFPQPLLVGPELRVELVAR